MGIICNGIQRSGTHLLAKCVENCGYHRIEGVLRANEFDNKGVTRKMVDSRSFMQAFGEYDCVIGHATYPAVTGDNKVLFITRNPLDWVVSVARYKTPGRPITPTREMLEHTIKDKMHKLFGYVGWLYKADLVVRFEDITRGMYGPIANIANLLRSDEPLDVICSKVNIESKTYTGALSKYNELFNNELYELFRENHGNELMELFGYE